MMKKQLIILAMLVALQIGYSQTPSHTPRAGFVPNAETAVKVAEAVLIPVYGEKHILSERPFKATLDGDVWTVDGTVPCEQPEHGCLGGAAQVKISKSTGQILFMIHYK
jgi:NTF2 fold immunity protein